MALTKETKEDKIEIVGDYKNIQIRTATIIKEDGVEINRSFHRRILDCISSSKDEDNNWVHTDTDVSGESSDVQGIAATVWTTEIKNAKKTSNENA
tara:strand:+ start:1088 stop:1375 length:288 start_codon:yes stop_codon:yes gene_type:complete